MRVTPRFSDGSSNRTGHISLVKPVYCMNEQNELFGEQVAS